MPTKTVLIFCRKGWWLQSHGVQKPELQGRFLLGVPGSLGASRKLLVQLQQVNQYKFVYVSKCKQNYPNLSGMMRRMLKELGTARSDPGRRCSGICSTATAT